MRVTVEVLRSLLDAAGDAALVLLEGRLSVVPGAALGTPDWAGAVVVVTRDGLVERAGSADPSERELTEVAAALDVEEASRGA